jgi:hypothetical protein
MRSRLSVIFIGLGIFFLINAIFGRYLVLPGYLQSLEQGRSTLESASQTVSTWKVIRYLVWAYSFKLGIYLLAVAATFRTRLSASGRWLIALGGLVYIGVAYIPLPAPSSLVFGLSGGLMTVLMVFIFLRWARDRDQLQDHERRQSDYRAVGYFFFAMATYTLCALMGVKAFALSPEKMIAYELQGEAASFAFHVLIELVLGWIFVSLSFRGRPSGASSRPIEQVAG